MRKNIPAFAAALLLALTACGSATPPTETAPPTTTASPAVTADSITITGEAPPQVTYSQTYPRYAATILAQAESTPAFGDFAETLDAGIAARDDIVEDLLDITLTRETVDNMTATVTRRAQAGETADLLEFASTADAASLAPGGHLADLAALPTLQLDQPAFDAALNDELTIAGHAYFLFGDATVGDKAATSVMHFDPAAAMTAGIEPDTIFDAVRGGEWTVDFLQRLAVNGNLYLTREAIVPIFLASGGKIFDRDATGKPILVTGETFSRAYAAIQALMSASGDEAEGAVFTVGSLADLGEGELAIPLPALERGAPYHAMVDPARAACVSVPANLADPARTGDILTAYFVASTAVIAEPLREYLVADNDAVLLDCVLSSRTCAIGALFGWGDLAEALTESVGVPEKEFLAASAMRMTTAARAMEIFLERLG